jgi:hypothetical protein
MPDYLDEYPPQKPVKVQFTDDEIVVTLYDGRVIANPLAWHPWLQRASDLQRSNYELLPFSIEWPDLDEGLSIEGMLQGKAQRVKPEGTA